MYRPDRWAHWRVRSRTRLMLTHLGRMTRRRALLILTYRIYR